MHSEFQYLNRGFKESLVLIPGWATDYRIFNSLDLEYNYLMPLKLNYSDFSGQLAKALDKEGIDTAVLFGWSMGGFLAMDFYREYPLRVKELILVGIRQFFDKQLLNEIVGRLRESKKAFLYKFYLDVFGQDKNNYSWFKKNLMRKYLQDNTEAELINGLRYLENSRIHPQELTQIKKIRIFHANDDLINPFSEAFNLSSNTVHAEFITLKKSSHAAFLSQEFKESFKNG